MAKYQVFGWAKVGVTVTVEADSSEEATDKAYETFGGLSGYCGNGGTDKLVGVNDSDVSLDADGDYDFIDAEVVT